ncbi:MAG: GNAT family N-acetyltransferase, partial [Gaiellaceae bacterium]
MTGTAVAASAVEFSTLTTIEDFDELRPEWDELVRAMPRPSPFLLHSWLSAWWREYGADTELAVHIARRDGALIGALPLLVRRRLGLDVTTFVGRGQSALADMLLAPSADATVASRLAERLSDRGAGYLDVYGLPQSSRLHAALGRELQLVERVEAPVLDLTPSWGEVYAEKTSSKKRNL